MRMFIRKSFKRRQLVCFLLVALLPLFITSVFLTQIVKAKVESDYEKEVTGQAERADAALTEIFSEIEQAAERIGSNQKIVSVVDETDSWTRNRAYTQFYEETDTLREYAQFDIYNREGKCVYSTGDRSKVRSLPTYWGILKAAQGKPDTLVFLRGEQDDPQQILLQAARTIENKKKDCVGYLVISMTGENFDGILRGVLRSQEGIAILDAYWETIYSVGTAEEENIGYVLRQRLMNGEQLMTTYDSNGIFISSLGDTGMYKVLLRPDIFSTNVVRTMYTVTLLMGMISFLLCVLLAERMSNSLTFPIKRMNDAMHKVQEGHLETRIPVDRQDELGQMSENFNIMANKLSDYMERQVRAQQELNASHIAMMQAQMNPHFLYNTLDTMKWLAKANHIPEIATMSAGLARILRTSISAEQFIPLKEEMELVSSYAQIQKIRYNDRFCFEVDMPKQLENCIVPKLVIQPLVENAVIHGLEEAENGQICVTVYEKDEKLKIDVKDNGCGIPEDIMECLNKREREKLTGHIGFYNVDTIIRLHYGEGYGLHVEKPVEGGTLISVTLPINNE